MAMNLSANVQKIASAICRMSAECSENVSHIMTFDTALQSADVCEMSGGIVGSVFGERLKRLVKCSAD